MGETSLRPSASAGRLPMPLAPPTIGRCAPSAFSAISAAQVRPLLTTGRVRHHGSISHGSAHPPPPSLWRTGKARPYRIAVGPDLVSGPGFGADTRSTSSSVRRARQAPVRQAQGLRHRRQAQDDPEFVERAKSNGSRSRAKPGERSVLSISRCGYSWWIQPADALLLQINLQLDPLGVFTTSLEHLRLNDVGQHHRTRVGANIRDPLIAK